jgi:hypothetical protein
MSETSVSLGSPHPRVAPTLPINVPVLPSQAPSVCFFVKLVPRQRDTKNIVKAISKTRVSQDSPHSRAAPMLPMPIAVPARASQAPSMPPSVNAIPRRRDTKNVVSEFDESSTSRLSPTLEAAAAPPKSLPLGSQLPLRPLLLLEEDGTVSKAEERQPVITAVSKIITSVIRHSHAPAPFKRKYIVPGGNTAELARSPQASQLTRQPTVRDKMPRASYPNAVSASHILSFPQSSFKADISKQHITNIGTENKRRVYSPGARTAPTLSKSMPARIIQACSVSLPSTKEPAIRVKTPALLDKVVNDLDGAKPVPPSQACPVSFTYLPNSKYSVTLKTASALHRRDIVSRVAMTSDKYSHDSRKTIAHPHVAEGCSVGRSEVPPLQACPASFTCLPNSKYSATLKTASALHRRDIVSRVAMMSDKYSHDSHETIACPHVAEGCSVGRSKVPSEPGLCDPEPQAQPLNLTRPSDMLWDSEAVSKRTDTGCLSSPQARLEAAIRQPPGPQLIDTVAALMHAHLARRAASEEFCLCLPKHLADGYSAERSAPTELHLRIPRTPPDKSVAGEGQFCPRVPEVLPDESVAGEREFHPPIPKYLPDGFLGTDTRCSDNIVSKTIRTSMFYLPLPKTALSQASIPRPGFNGHKPVLFIEREGWLEVSAVNKINRRSIVECSPVTPETVSGQSQAVELREWSE